MTNPAKHTLRLENGYVIRATYHQRFIPCYVVVLLNTNLEEVARTTRDAGLFKNAQEAAERQMVTWGY